MFDRFAQETADGFLAWDLETTGLDVATCRMIELAVYRVVPGQGVPMAPELALDRLVFHPWPLDQEIVKLTGITDEMLAEQGHSLFDVLQELKALRGLPLVGHYCLPFDLRVLTRMYGLVAEAFYGFGPIIDTATMFKAKQLGIVNRPDELLSGFQERVLEVHSKVKFNLDAACAAEGVETSGVKRHRAAGDALLTARLFERLVGRAKKEGG